MNKLLALLEMLICLAGINICFGLWSVKQERIVKFPYEATGPASKKASSDYFSTTFVIGLSQTMAGLVVGLITLVLQKLYGCVRRASDKGVSSAKAQGKEDRVGPLRWRDMRQIASMGFTNAFGTSLGYAAMRRLPYPVALAAKMSKMVPVMVVGFVWYGRRYPMKKVASCMLLTLGVIGFYLLKDDTESGQHASEKTAGLVGFSLILVNLIMDGFTNSTQDELVRRRGWSSAELMVCANAASTAWLLAISCFLETAELPVRRLVYGTYEAFHLDSYAGVMPAAEFIHTFFAFHDLSHALAFLDTHHGALRDLGLMSLMNALGQIFIFRTIASFGGLAMTGMTLVRKAGSIVLSIVIHGHVLNTYQVVALAAILAGVVWDGWLNISSRTGGAKAGDATAKPARGKATGGTAKKKQKSSAVNGGTSNATPRTAKVNSGGGAKAQASAKQSHQAVQTPRKSAGVKPLKQKNKKKQ